MENPIEPRWRKSSRSGNGGGDCVEVATHHSRNVMVRDSKDPDGPVLTTTPQAWARLLTHIQSSQFTSG